MAQTAPAIVSYDFLAVIVSYVVATNFCNYTPPREPSRCLQTPPRVLETIPWHVSGHFPPPSTIDPSSVEELVKTI